MFWIKKGSTTYCTSWNYGASYDGSHYYMYVNYMTLSVAVAGSYAGNSAYTTDGNKISAMTTAAANAHAIINDPDYANLSATERLAAYKNEICDLTTYNYDAARGEFTRVTGYEYGDPWQLIWVFDNDPSTTVVCEGYSKAFMYLCDETDWGNNNVDAICVTGEMSTWENGVLDGGAHMWNIVTVEGVSYLVDVTNSDQGSIGYSGGLFMDGYDQKDAEGRTYIYETAGGQVIYAYDMDTIQTLAESNKLNVAGTAAATQVQLICDGVADDGGAILLPVHGKLRFTVRADSAIRNEIRGARLVLFSVPAPDATVPLPLFDVYKKELRISGSFINPDTQLEAAQLISSGRLQLDALITHRFPVEETDKAIGMQQSPDAVKVVVTP